MYNSCTDILTFRRLNNVFEVGKKSNSLSHHGSYVYFMEMS